MTVEQALAGAEKDRARYYTRQGRPVAPRQDDAAKPKAVNRDTNGGWPSWCVPTTMLVQFIRDNEHAWEAEFSPLPRNEKLDSRSTSSHRPPALTIDQKGWRQLLTARVSRTLKVSEPGVSRRLYEIMYDKRRVTNAEFAAAVCISLGLDLDADTQIPTLPGNQKAAEELIRCRADAQNAQLDDLEVKRLAHKTVRIAKLIVAYPHNLERLQDLAPYDCLRPYR